MSRTLLSFQANVSNAVVWMISDISLISDTSTPFPRFLRPFSGRTYINWYISTLSFFSSLVKSKYLTIFSFPFIFLLWSAETSKSKNAKLSFFSFINRWSILPNEIMRSVSNSKPPKIFMGHSLWNWFSFVYIPFGGMVKFQSLAQFPVDQLSHQGISGLVLFFVLVSCIQL